MSYEKTIEILKEDKGFEYFLTLDQQELEQLFESLSDADEKKIVDYLKERNHTPKRRKRDATKPAFLERVRETHQSIAFSDPRKEILSNYNEEPIVVNTRKNFITVEEDSYNYPYYSVVRGMLLTLLDEEPQPEAIKMMHSQLQSLFKGIIQPNLINGLQLNQSTKKGSYLLHSKPRRKTTRLDLAVIKKYLSEIFEKQYRCFKEFMAGSRKLMSAMDQENFDEIAKEASEQSDDEQSITAESDAFTDRYFLERTKNMTDEQFQRYSENRTLNFTMSGNEKLTLFVDTRNLLLHRYTNKQLFKLISFILCRSLQQIVFRIMHEKFGEVKPVQNFTVDVDDVRRVGNEYLDRVAKRARTYALKFSTYLKKARNLFKEQFQQMGYDEIYSKQTRIKLIKKGDEIEEDYDPTEPVWHKSRNLRKMWFQRVEAQAQYNLHHGKNSLPSAFLNDYSRLIFSRKEDYEKIGAAAFFKQYFLKEHLEKPVEIPTGRLQSLFD